MGPGNLRGSNSKPVRDFFHVSNKSALNASAAWRHYQLMWKFSGLLFAIVSLTALSASGGQKYELRKVCTACAGGWQTLSTHSSNQDCAAAKNRASQADPKGSYGCWGVPDPTPAPPPANKNKKPGGAIEF